MYTHLYPMKQLLDPTVAPDKLLIIIRCSKNSTWRIAVLLLANPCGLLVYSSAGIIKTVFVIIYSAYLLHNVGNHISHPSRG
jgi:hypothetical protein